jgi:hypothetical protein
VEAALPHNRQGMSPDEWQALVERCRTFLIGIASQRRTTTYAELMEALGVNRFKLNWVLGDVTKIEKEAGRPGLSALVLYANEPKPGGGFAAWCQENGWLDEDADDEAKYIFWLKEMHASWTRWSGRSS